jgi:hypothetical protein
MVIVRLGLGVGGLRGPFRIGRGILGGLRVAHDHTECHLRATYASLFAVVEILQRIRPGYSGARERSRASLPAASTLERSTSSTRNHSRRASSGTR